MTPRFALTVIAVAALSVPLEIAVNYLYDRADARRARASER